MICEKHNIMDQINWFRRKSHANLATRVKAFHDDEVDSQPGQDEAGDELKVDHSQAELDAVILSQDPMPGWEMRS